MELERVLPQDRFKSALWSLLLGNFVIGCGVMVVGGTLNDLTHSLGISVLKGGQLLAIAALMMGFGAPLLAWLIGHVDRRKLLAWTMLWFAAGHMLCALAPTYEWLWPARALTVLSAAVFTPQAAATAGFMSTPARRGQAITFVFMGWAIASVLGMPLTSWVGERLGWRVAMMLIGSAAVVSAWLVWRKLPGGIHPPALSLRSWGKVLRSPLLMAVVAVTAFQSAGQFTLLGYIAPYLKQVFAASPEGISLMFGWFGALALAGNVLLSRSIDRVGAAPAVTLTLAMMAIGLLIWPLAASLPALAVVMIPWAISGFATNSGQQARLGGLSPRLAPALMALNTSAIYLGHALGASGGGWVIANHGYESLHWLALLWMIVALALSVWAMRIQRLHVVQREDALDSSQTMR
jgi:DHA1 family inner membrane transport protein